MTDGFFLTGTDTNVGKTFVAALLLKKYPELIYYKPVQSGDFHTGGDTAFVQKYANLPDARIIPPAYAFQAPLSPHLAARLENQKIELEKLTPPDTGKRPLCIEGAGGVLVPVNENNLMIDVMKIFGLPVIIVCRSSLGTINHTLLTLEALRGRGLTVAGVIINGEPNSENRKAIEAYGATKILGEVPYFQNLNNIHEEEVYLSIK